MPFGSGPGDIYLELVQALYDGAGAGGGNGYGAQAAGPTAPEWAALMRMPSFAGAAPAEPQLDAATWRALCQLLGRKRDRLDPLQASVGWEGGGEPGWRGRLEDDAALSASPLPNVGRACACCPGGRQVPKTGAAQGRGACVCRTVDRACNGSPRSSLDKSSVRVQGVRRPCPKGRSLPWVGGKRKGVGERLGLRQAVPSRRRCPLQLMRRFGHGTFHQAGRDGGGVRVGTLCPVPLRARPLPAWQVLLMLPDGAALVDLMPWLEGALRYAVEGRRCGTCGATCSGGVAEWVGRLGFWR